MNNKIYAPNPTLTFLPQGLVWFYKTSGSLYCERGLTCLAFLVAILRILDICFRMAEIVTTFHWENVYWLSYVMYFVLWSSSIYV